MRIGLLKAHEQNLTLLYPALASARNPPVSIGTLPSAEIRYSCENPASCLVSSVSDNLILWLTMLQAASLSFSASHSCTYSGAPPISASTSPLITFHPPRSRA